MSNFELKKSLINDLRSAFNFNFQSNKEIECVPSNYAPKRVSHMTVLHIFADMIWKCFRNVMEGVKNKTWQCPEDEFLFILMQRI